MSAPKKPFVDHYAALGTTGPMSDVDAIHKLYKKAALCTHPDKNEGKDEDFKRVQAAWDELKNVDTRFDYNKVYEAHYKTPYTPQPQRKARPYSQSFPSSSSFSGSRGHSSSSAPKFSSAQSSKHRFADETPSGGSKRPRTSAFDDSDNWFPDLDASDDGDLCEEIPRSSFFGKKAPNTSGGASNARSTPFASKPSASEAFPQMPTKPLPNENELKDALLNGYADILEPFGVSEPEYKSIRDALAAGGDSGIGRVVTRTLNTLRDYRSSSTGKRKEKGKQM